MSLFESKTSAVSSFRGEFTATLGAYVNLAAMSDDAIYRKLLAAEKSVSRSLRVFLEPTIMVPDDATQDEIDLLEAEGANYAQEAAYDYDPDFFSAGTGGYVVTKQKPIISVESMRFYYPGPTQRVWEIPKDWIRLDRKYGHIRLVPQAMSVSVPIASFVLNALGGGKSIPFMIQIRYTAGLKDAANDFPDVIDVINKEAALKILQSAFLPNSGSISADGLSQSQSIDMQKWSDMINERLNTLRDAIHGIRVMTV